MASQILSNSKLWVAGYDWSGDVNALALRYLAEAKDNTSFASAGTRSRVPGLKDFSFQHEGFWNGGAGNVDDAIFQNVAVNAVPMSIAPQTGVEGEPAYSGQVDIAAYAPGAKIGDVFAFSVSGEAYAGPLVRGTVMVNGTKAATGNGTIFQLGAVGAGQKIYAALHVFAPVSGSSPTLNFKVQSAAAIGFSSPTDRITFTQMTAQGGQWGPPAAGPITDQYWRVVWTLGGSTPSFPIAAIVGIQ